jgi:hypothetical protein
MTERPSRTVKHQRSGRRGLRRPATAPSAAIAWTWKTDRYWLHGLAPVEVHLTLVSFALPSPQGSDHRLSTSLHKSCGDLNPRCAYTEIEAGGAINGEKMIIRSDDDIDALFCLVLGRYPASDAERRQKFGKSQFAIIDDLVRSREFAEDVLKPVLYQAPTPHERLGLEDLWLVLGLALEAGLSPNDDAGGTRDVCYCDDLMGLDDARFVEAAFWEILLRSPDPEGEALYLGRLAAGDTKRGIIADIAASEELRMLGRPLAFSWRDDSFPSDGFRIGDEVFVREAYRAILSRDPDPDGLEHYVSTLASGAVSRRRIIEILLTSSEADERQIGPSALSFGGSPLGWSAMLYLWFHSGPLARILIRHQGHSAQQFLAMLTPMTILEWTDRSTSVEGLQLQGSMMKDPEFCDTRAAAIYEQIVSRMIGGSSAGKL